MQPALSESARTLVCDHVEVAMARVGTELLVWLATYTLPVTAFTATATGAAPTLSVATTVCATPPRTCPPAVPKPRSRPSASDTLRRTPAPLYLHGRTGSAASSQLSAGRRPGALVRGSAFAQGAMRCEQHSGRELQGGIPTAGQDRSKTKETFTLA
jgi:hypothetical protein